MLKHFWSVFLLVLFVSGISFFFYDRIYHFYLTQQSVYNTEPQEGLNKLGQRFLLRWQNEVKESVYNESLPEQWDSVRNVKLIFKSELAQPWEGHLVTPVPIREDGQYDLEILVLDWTENSVQAVILQYDFFNRDTKNLEYEFGHTVYLNE